MILKVLKDGPATSARIRDRGGLSRVHNAATAGSGQNIDNTTRQAVKSILNNPKARRGFSQEELEQMARISRGTFVGIGARYLGNLMGGGGGLRTSVSAG